jgi:hypothetical protein
MSLKSKIQTITEQVMKMEMAAKMNTGEIRSNLRTLEKDFKKYISDHP